MAYQPTMIPDIVIQELDNGAGGATGAPVTGVAPDGELQDVDPGQPYFNGRIWKYRSCTDGGLFVSSDQTGQVLQSLHWTLPGAATLKAYLVDPGGSAGDFLVMDDTLLDNISPASAAAGGMWTPRDGLFIPPRWELKVVSTGNLSGLASIAFAFGAGWAQKPMQSIVTG